MLLVITTNCQCLGESQGNSGSAWRRGDSPDRQARSEASGGASALLSFQESFARYPLRSFLNDFQNTAKDSTAPLLLDLISERTPLEYFNDGIEFQTTGERFCRRGGGCFEWSKGREGPPLFSHPREV